MKAPRNLSLSVVALGIAMLFGTSAAHAQLYYVSPIYPWSFPTTHDFTFTSISSVNDLKYWGYTYGFNFTGTTANHQTISVQVLGPGGNLIGSRIGVAEMMMMREVVRAFQTKPEYSQLRLLKVERRYGAYTVTAKTRMRALVGSPQASTHGGKSGGLVELEVDGGNGEFYVESVIRRGGSCSSGAAKDSRMSVLRRSKSFILNGQTFYTTLNPASVVMARLFVEEAVKAVGNTVLDVSGSVKLEEDAPHRDPYHVSAGRCGSTYIIDSNQYITVRRLRN